MSLGEMIDARGLPFQSAEQLKRWLPTATKGPWRLDMPPDDRLITITMKDLVDAGIKPARACLMILNMFKPQQGEKSYRGSNKDGECMHIPESNCYTSAKDVLSDGSREKGLCAVAGMPAAQIGLKGNPSVRVETPGRLLGQRLRQEMHDTYAHSMDLALPWHLPTFQS